MFQQIVLIQAWSRYITVYCTSMMERKSVMRNNVHDGSLLFQIVKSW